MKKVKNWLLFLGPSLMLVTMLTFLNPAQEIMAQAGITNFDNVTINQDILVGDDGTFGGNLSVAGTLVAAAYITDTGDVSIPGGLTVTDTLDVASDTTIGGDLNVTGNITGGGVLDITGATTLGGALDVTGAATVGGNAVVTGTSTLVGQVNTTGDAVIGDDLTVTDDTRLGGLFSIAAEVAISVTNGGAFTPTGTYQPLTSGGTVTPTITAGAQTGRLVTLINTSATTINLADSGTLKLSAAAALGQYDVLQLISDGTNWIELGRSNN